MDCGTATLHVLAVAAFSGIAAALVFLASFKLMSHRARGNSGPIDIESRERTLYHHLKGEPPEYAEVLCIYRGEKEIITKMIAKGLLKLNGPRINGLPVAIWEYPCTGYYSMSYAAENGAVLQVGESAQRD